MLTRRAGFCRSPERGVTWDPNAAIRGILAPQTEIGTRGCTDFPRVVAEAEGAAYLSAVKVRFLSMPNLLIAFRASLADFSLSRDANLII